MRLMRVSLDGDLTASLAPRLQVQLLAAADHADVLVVDLSQVTGISAAALRVLVGVRSRLLTDGCRLRVTGASPAVLIAFARAGVRWLPVRAVPAAG